MLAVGRRSMCIKFRMAPAFRSFPLETLEKVFVQFDIHLLEKFSDGQTRWGNKPMSKPYKGRSSMAQRYEGFSSPGRDFYDIFTIRAIVDRLGRTEQLAAIEAALEQSSIEG